MLTPQFVLPIASELVVDLFAGGGGASTGIEQAIGRHVDIAVNHDPEAVSLHTVNHPQTRHFISDVFEVDPVEVTGGQPVGLLWASPDCKHFSKAKGGKPVSKKIRGLAWVVVAWIRRLAECDPGAKPRVICLENVEEFQTWGPLGDDDRPCPLRKGETFNEWLAALRSFGYVVEWRELRASDYGTPTIRKRLFLVARCDGLPIVWPEPTHGKPGTLPVKAKKLPPWRTAAECIDWTIPCPSIFERSRPLADATLRRVAKGVMRYVVDAAEPFIVGLAHGEHADRAGSRSHGIGEPIRTIHAGGGNHALVIPTLVQTGYGERPGQAPRVPGLEKPLGTAVDGQKHALVAAFLAKHYTGVVGSEAAEPIGTVTSVDHHSLVTAHITKFRTGSTGHDAREPLHTVTANGHVKRPGGAAPLGVVTSNLVKLRGTSTAQATDEPLHTVSAQGQHFAEVRAFLLKYYGTDQDPQLAEPLHTVTTKDRFALVTVHGEQYAIVDIGLRMLSPRELYRAQGFPDTYQIDHGARGEPLTKTAQVRMCGNSVCPPLARAIVAANYRDSGLERVAA
ncbi:DNA (cytosine-5-)-methyltransferase [Xenophilus aerolatus]|nr:DNA (cytosine-5-)-methyltransferase [Xenophilus aerolatus]